jgi:hypothetical protein
MSEGDRFFRRILELVDADPFQPFDIRTSDGRGYFVDSPAYFARSREGEPRHVLHARRRPGGDDPCGADRFAGGRQPPGGIARYRRRVAAPLDT